MVNIDINDPSVDPQALVKKFKDWLVKHNRDYADGSFLISSVYLWVSNDDAITNNLIDEHNEHIPRLLRVWETAGFIKSVPKDNELYVFNVV